MHDNAGDPSPQPPEPPRPAPRRQSSVARLLILIACCAALLWAWQYATRDRDPAIADARVLLRDAERRLESDQPSDRISAVNDLARLFQPSDPIAVPPLIKALSDPDASVRAAAAAALGPTAGNITRSLGGDSIAREAAAALIATLKDSDPAVRAASASSLGIFGTQRPALGQSRLVDLEATSAALVGLLSDDDPTVRLAATKAIMGFEALRPAMPPPALLARLKDVSPQNRAAAITAVAQFRKGADLWFPSILRQLEHETDPAVRAQALAILSSPQFLVDSPPLSLVPEVSNALKSPDPVIRGKIARFAGFLRGRGVDLVPDLLALLNAPLDPALQDKQHVEVEEDNDPGSEAASALGAIAPGTDAAPRVIAELTEVARSGPLIRRIRTVYALGQFGPDALESVDALIGVLRDPASNQYIRDEFANRPKNAPPTPNSADTLGAAEAARALGKIAPNTPRANDAVAALLEALDSPAPPVRMAAARSLEPFGIDARPAIPKLRKLLADPAMDVRAGAIDTLRELGAIPRPNPPS